MNIIALQPTDVLFFRDGRPMEGSLAGHTAAWPLPDVTNHALHAALHRAGLEGVHAHRRGRSGQYTEDRDRLFGCLKTAGPFPVRVGQASEAAISPAPPEETQPSGRRPDPQATWFFPRPKDAQQTMSVAVTLNPAKGDGPDGRWQGSSLPAPLKYAVANTQPPSKEAGGEPWLSRAAFEAYLQNPATISAPPTNYFLRDTDIADQEAQIGIAIDPDTQTTGHDAVKGKIYSAHYLRLREEFRLGLLAEAMDKIKEGSEERRDLIKALLNDHPAQILVGGQQRVCTARRHDVPAKEGLPLPCGLSQGFNQQGGKYLVKWVLLTPAVWPEIPGGISKRGTQITGHPGGWLPNWVNPETGEVLLTNGPGVRKAERTNASAGGKISARLVAAIVPKPIVVTGWALPNAKDPDRPADGGAKSTHLAVPAGAVYYFEADSETDAKNLAAALNWHGSETQPATIKNRRSTLLGEKGYGLGVCGTWQFYPAT